MGATRKKLDESQFFIWQMDANRFKHPDLAYYLSAFISAARSVPWVMQHEFANTVGWRAWYDSKIATFEEAVLLNGLNQLRVRTVKKETPEIQYQVAFKIPKTGLTRELEEFLNEQTGRQVHVSVEVAKGETPTTVTEEQTSFPAKLETLFPIVPEFPDTDMLEICERYVSWLSDLVLECEARFGAEELAQRSNAPRATS